MRAFRKVTAKVAPLDRANVDTDAIIPKQFLKSIRRSGFGPYLFDEWRYLDRGEPDMDCSNRPLNPDFVLNQPCYMGARILLARENFGCGSSREHAPWALEDYGFRVIIAPSFADIFYNNCFKNGLLPIVLDAATVDRLFKQCKPGYTLTVDLPEQTITTPFGERIHFAIDASRKYRLLNGLDDIALTLQHAEAIKAYEARRRLEAPWLFAAVAENTTGSAMADVAVVSTAQSQPSPFSNNMTKKIAVLPGDGIGPEIVAEALKVLHCLRAEFGLQVETEEALIGGAAYDATGTPFPEETLSLARQADAVLLGAVGGPKWEPLDYAVRPERGLLGLRSELGLFANLRPAVLYPQLAAASTLKPEVVSGLDLLIVRELNGGIYFGQPRGRRLNEQGEREGFNTLVYSESEIRRIAHVAFESAMKRNKRLCSIDKANVLECTELWREVVSEVSKDYPEVTLSHMYVDNAAMQLVRNPKQFDVMLTDNMFGDILSDCAAMLTGSIGMLPSASLDKNGKGMYEPIHGSAPDIAGQGIANPIATILSLAMLLRYSFNDGENAARIEHAVSAALDAGYRTADIYSKGTQKVSTAAMGDAIVAALRAAAN